GWSRDGGIPPPPNARRSCGCWTARTIGSGNGSSATNVRMTPNSKPSSDGSAPCRIDWRPSRWLLAALLMLALAAPLAVLASELAPPAAWLLAAAALVQGLRLAAREW